MNLLLLFLLVVAFSAVFAYFVFNRAKGDWNIIPEPFHYLVLPLYCFACFYFGVLAFQIACFIPRGLSLLMNYIVSLIASITGNEVYWSIWTIIGDILVIPVLAMCIALPVEFIVFKGDDRTTYGFRLAALILLTLAMVIGYAVGPIEDIAWYDRTIFVIGTLIGSVISYWMIQDEHKGNRNGDFLGRLFSGFKRFFSKENPLIRKRK